MPVPNPISGAAALIARRTKLSPVSNCGLIRSQTRNATTANTTAGISATTRFTRRVFPAAKYKAPQSNISKYHNITICTSQGPWACAMVGQSANVVSSAICVRKLAMQSNVVLCRGPLQSFDWHDAGGPSAPTQG